jgi:hypothetical protein
MKIALVFLLALASFASADQYDKLYFEPTQADFDCCHKAIGKQQKEYKAAKKAGDYDKSVELSLSYWTRAWLHFNKGMATAKGAGKDEAALQEALNYLSFAEADATRSSDSRSSEILEKVSKNRKLIQAKVSKLEKASK